METKIIVLSLERSEKRRKLLEDQFERLNITDYMFFPAFDAKHIINQSIGGTIITGSGLGRKFNLAEIAITFGHLSILKHAQMMDYDNIVVLEDDIVLCEDWKDRIDYLLKFLPEDWEYVYLSGHSDYVKFQKYDEPTILRAPKMIGAFSYMVNKRAYSKISAYCSSLSTTYDDMIMNMTTKNKLISYIFFPFMTYHNAEESLIWQEDSSKYVKNAGTQHSSYYFFKKILKL